MQKKNKTLDSFHNYAGYITHSNPVGTDVKTTNFNIISEHVLYGVIDLVAEIEHYYGDLKLGKILSVVLIREGRETHYAPTDREKTQDLSKFNQWQTINTI
ncbi:hypothetical protein [Alishewanella phage vB_AspM_Slicko01]|nr:hypothetical protein [Alishewanella phage vB_AspM_Slicko01]